ncbi:MAG: enhanced intracellular survival protein Eis [Tepidisphaerales bacterium]
MALTHRWTGRNDAELLAWLRLHCYGGHTADYAKYLASVTDDDRARDGQFLIVERDGRPVGTATSVDLTMHLRGAGLPCHGVAYVGTIRTERRKGKRGGERGVASEVMWRTIERGRERGDAVSALMPFRASFYEHFGYGIVEEHARWTLPMGVLPAGGEAGNYTPFQPSHLPDLKRLRQRIVETGAADLHRTDGVWANLLKAVDAPGGGFLFVDESPTSDGQLPLRAWVQLVTETDGTGAAVARVADYGVTEAAAMRGLLGFLGSLRDQYAKAVVTTPVDWPVPRLLLESQVPHRPVSHATAGVSRYTRMMVRVLDHARTLEAMAWPRHVRGAVVVSIQECEGHESRFHIEVADGRAAVKPAATPADLTLPDRTWAGVVCGDLSISHALRWGLAEGEDRDGVLACLWGGPRPFTWEYF